MTKLLIRGRVLTFRDEPQSLDDSQSYRYIEDGAVLVENGRITRLGDYAEISAEAGSGVKVADHRPHLILPGFIDTHIHYPQTQVVASYAANLLEWLNTYTFVAEQKFADEQHAEFIAERFLDELIRHGTTTAVAYCSVHPQSVDAYFRASQHRNMRMLGGKVMMDRNAPPALCDTAQSGYDDSKQLIARWHGKDRLDYVITPRFAITSTPEQLEASQALAREHPECFIQTHLSENHEEIEFTKSLYPDAPDYLGIYEHYGLLGSKTLLGHSIHLEEREVQVMAETGSVAVFCPTSNLFLGSGLFDRDRLKASGVRMAVATDVGGGTSFSMLRTMDEGYKVLQLRGSRLNPFQSFYMMTLGNARALSMEDKIGTLDEGTEADIVVLDSAATSPMRLRMAAGATLEQELFLLQTVGDDRAIVETYIAGKPLKAELA
ncbi:MULTISPECIES: guanine deaminase [Brucella]|uniref:Guanine deaminase n=1 Tax=Brucella pituitosa TaxID=571256 RepID=A0A643F5H8_9HYPH|nr:MULTISPECIES: guanine deaminase [Brucella]PQZ49360.1 guanine deaminase [Ochrobactrum sp. MYb19]PRA57420.1 guanine deaminase [Ochrobactrum sp. MYb68]PRA66822.1 guanine deaminase [Ochrobactrum sp. MYb18]PRA76149.1 guanine deaminase [Brucella thiophenivorans]PRA91832.1 guanine deaminase [Ochrobactrum sp. MYb14]PRA98156.1 guanine deaminase [Ochrobactrum sp. MYb15]